MGGFVGGQQAWEDHKYALEAKIKKLEKANAPIFKAWEQLKFDLNEHLKNEPNAPENPNS